VVYHYGECVNAYAARFEAWLGELGQERAAANVPAQGLAALARGEKRSPIGDGPLPRVRRWWEIIYPAQLWETAWVWCVEVEQV